MEMEASGPNWAEIMTAWGTVALAVFTLALAVAAGFALVQIREVRRARNAQVALEMSARWTDAAFRRVRQKVDEAAKGEGALKQAMLDHYNSGADEYRSFLMEPDYFEDLGVLVNHGGIDFDVVRDSLGITVARRWDKWRPFINHLRDEIANPTAFSRFEDLAKRIREAETLDERNRRRRRR